MDNKRLAAVVVVAIVVCVAFSYAVYDEDGRTGPSWNYSNIVGNLPDTVPDAADDFYLNTDYDWILEHQGTATSDSALITLQSLASTVINNLTVTDPDDPNVAVYRQFALGFMDMASRESTGLDEIMPYISGLMEAQTLADLSEYLVSDGNVIAPPFLDVEILGLNNLTDDYIPIVSYASLTLSSPSLYLGDDFRYYMDPAEDHYSVLLQLVGYSAEEADAMNDAATALEVVLASNITLSGTQDSETLYNPYTSEDLDALCGSFPILEVLAAYGYPADVYSILDVGWLQALDSIYTEENFEGLRTMLLRNTLDIASAYMGGDFLAEFLDYNGTTLESYFATLVSSNPVVVDLINTMYCDHAANPEAEELVVSLFENLKDAMAVRISEADWMSDQTKEYALQKLEAMEIYVGGPDSVDFSSLTLPSATGGSALDGYIAMREYYAENKAELIGQTIDVPMWPLQGYVTNAFNAWSMNAVFVSWAILQDGYYYQSDASIESIIARLATTIGHEITHSFDSIGSQYGMDGTLTSWWTESDAEAFSERVSAVSDYVSSITLTPDRTMDPSIVINEVIADMGGMALALDLAADIEGFDYAEMFREYADLWSATYTQSYDDMYLSSDEHPPNCARVNMTVQQFQEFMDAFGVSEGDGMYLSPEDRVAIW